MNDFDDLTDAFSELERRADVATARRRDDQTIERPSRRGPQSVLVAAAVVAVLVVALGVALLARTGGRGHAPSAGSPGERTHTPAPISTPTSAAATTTTLRPLHTGSAPPAPVVPAATTPAAPSSLSLSPPPKPSPSIPRSARELAKRFRTTLGGKATFSIRLAEDNLPSRDPYILGVLTASGRRGGFDLQMLPIGQGTRAQCDAAPNGSTSTCTRRRLSDGSSLALGRVGLAGRPGGVTYQADLVTRDGIEIAMHLSNEGDPKGESTVLSAKPPLTLEQLDAIITSKHWFG